MQIRAVLDTNLWISYLISKELSKMDHLFERDGLVLLFSKELLEEFIEVADRPKFRRYFSHDDIEELLELLDHYGEIVDVTSSVDTCRDSKDNFLLALALERLGRLSGNRRQRFVGTQTVRENRNSLVRGV
jgi:putative PIN family toxin of toxin-antitoxin system